MVVTFCKTRLSEWEAGGWRLEAALLLHLPFSSYYLTAHTQVGAIELLFRELT